MCTYKHDRSFACKVYALRVTIHVLSYMHTLLHTFALMCLGIIDSDCGDWGDGTNHAVVGVGYGGKFMQAFTFPIHPLSPTQLIRSAIHTRVRIQRRACYHVLSQYLSIPFIHSYNSSNIQTSIRAFPGGLDEQPFWRFKNSFGVKWGEEGYFRVVRGVSMCNIGQMSSFPYVEPVDEF